MSFNHKRKGMEILVSPGSAVVNNHNHNRTQTQYDHQSRSHHHHVVVVSPTSANWQDVQTKMKDLYQRLVKDEEETKDEYSCNHNHDNEDESSSTSDCCTDDVLLAIRDVVREKHQINQAYMEMQDEAAHILQDLNEQVEQAKTACQMESEQAHQMQKRVSELCAARDAVVAELNATMQLTRQVQESMARHEQDALQQLDWHQQEIDNAKKKAARLQHQISLYARITGIKWDFDQATQPILAGHVAVPSQEAFRPFNIDPQQLSKFEVANKLWNLMDGQDV